MDPPVISPCDRFSQEGHDARITPQFMAVHPDCNEREIDSTTNVGFLSASARIR
jgi:hypothetical protein